MIFSSQNVHRATRTTRQARSALTSALFRVPGAAMMLLSAACAERQPAAPDDAAGAVAPLVQVAASAPCTGCTSYTGTLAPFGSTSEPDAGLYDEPVAGVHSGWLSGPAGSDFALRLQKWDSVRAAWVLVKIANVVGSPNESLSYTGAAGRYRWRVVSLKAGGAYQLWMKRPTASQPPPSGSGQFRSISAHGQNACAVTTTGTAYCWGHGAFGNLGDGNTTAWADVPVRVLQEPWDTIAVSHYTTCGLKTGKAYCWGGDTWGVLGQGTVLTSCPSPIAGGPGCSLVPLPVTGGHTFVQLTAGGNQDRSVGQHF